MPLHSPVPCVTQVHAQHAQHDDNAMHTQHASIVRQQQSFLTENFLLARGGLRRAAPWQ